MDRGESIEKLAGLLSADEYGDVVSSASISETTSPYSSDFSQPMNTGMWSLRCLPMSGSEISLSPSFRN